MKITNFTIIKITALFALGWTMACQTNITTSNSNSANQSANKPAVNVSTTPQPAKTTANINQPETNKTETAQTSGGSSLASPTEAYKTAYTARQKKDIPGLKRVLSKDMLEFFAMTGESEKKTVDEELTALAEKPQASTNETRNEKITGETATLEYPDEHGSWKTMDFVKEGSDWKLTFPSSKSSATMDKNKKK